MWKNPRRQRPALSDELFTVNNEISAAGLYRNRNVSIDIQNNKNNQYVNHKVGIIDIV